MIGRKMVMGDKVVLVAVGGSGGVFPKVLKEALRGSKFFEDRVRDIVFPTEKIYGMSGCTRNVVSQLTDLVIRTAKKYPQSRIFFVTQSFGGRAAAHTICQRLENRKGESNEEKHPYLSSLEKIPETFGGIISCGYPLNHKSQDRSYILTRLKYPILFLVGSKDKRCDIERLRNLTSSESMSSCDASLHVIDGGKHNAFDITPKSKAAEITEIALDKIEHFLFS